MHRVLQGPLHRLRLKWTTARRAARGSALGGCVPLGDALGMSQASSAAMARAAAETPMRCVDASLDPGWMIGSKDAAASGEA
jgi:hypothetical protein